MHCREMSRRHTHETKKALCNPLGRKESFSHGFQGTLPCCALKQVKSYQRSTMGDERLNGMAQLYINRNVTVNYHDVIDEFGKFNRRLAFK